MYLAGTTSSHYFIASGGHQTLIGGGQDAFLVKFSNTGVREWGTFYGGSSDEIGTSCGADDFGNVYLAGFTTSDSSIASGGYQNVYGGGDSDTFLAAFDSSGIGLWSTYYGGPAEDQGLACAIQDSSFVYLAGATRSTSDISYLGHQHAYGGTRDGFLVKFDLTDFHAGIAFPESQNPNFALWPNPFSGGNLNLLSPLTGNATVKLYDAIGRLHNTWNVQLTKGPAPLQLELPKGLANGNYSVLLKVNGLSTFQQITIVQ